MADNEQTTQTTETTTTTQQGSERPDYLPEQFWDAEKRAPNVEALVKSQADFRRALSRKASEYTDEDRQRIIGLLPDELREQAETNAKTKLRDDEEFVREMHERFRQQQEGEVPAAYEIDTTKLGYEPEANDPLAISVKAWAEENKLSKKAFDDLIGRFGESYRQLNDPAVLEANRAAAIKEIGANADARLKTAEAKLIQLLGEDLGLTVANLPMSGDHFRKLEGMLKKTGVSAPNLDDGAQSVPAMSEAELRSMMADPRYRDPMKRDPSFVTRVDAGFKRLYGE